jgi:hypothetical protein
MQRGRGFIKMFELCHKFKLCRTIQGLGAHMQGTGLSTGSFGERAIHELKEFLIIAAYLFVCSPP